MRAKDQISEILNQLGLSHFGFAKLHRPLSMDLYAAWIEDQHHLDMNYLKQHLGAKDDPASFFKAQSAIVLTIPYVPHPWPLELEFKNNIALYAQGKDYHQGVHQLLEPALRALHETFPNDHFRLCADSAPLLERDLAYRAGLGWIGKNTCLIHPKKGSLFFIAEILTSLELYNESPWSPDFCGKCNRCVEACPTQALTGEHQLLPARCISYWTIEAKDVAPESLRPLFKDWLFGCDICQTVCPWNQKHLPQAPRLKASSSEDSSSSAQKDELKWILNSSRKELARTLSNTPLARAAGWKLQRNAIIVAANKGYKELKPDIEQWLKDQKLGTLAQWAINNLI